MNFLCGNNSWIIILIVIILFCNSDYGFGNCCNNNSNSCGCNSGCGYCG